MNILGISTSPRPGGNTDLLLDSLLAGAAAAGALVEKIQLSDYRILPCSHCDYCLATGQCSIRDDMPRLYPKLINCDALAFAAPIYFMAHCAQAKLLIDRCQIFWARKYVLKETDFRPGERDQHKEPVPLGECGQAAPIPRRGVFIAVGASHGPKVFAGAKVTMQWFFDALLMEYWGNLLIDGCDEKAAIRSHPTALSQARQMGHDLATP